MSPAEVIARAMVAGYTRDERREVGGRDVEVAAAILAALDSAGLAVVPVEPTRKMIDALNGYAQCAGYIEEGYRAMVAAAKEGETND
jgi:hypothetical protein